MNRLNEGNNLKRFLNRRNKKNKREDFSKLEDYRLMKTQIVKLLRTKHGLTVEQAVLAIEKTHVKQLYLSNPEMFSHTSCEKWADDIFYSFSKNNSF